ncbi:hypothetical protein FCM35_KLT04323 [Carex littledalei]|uniref:CCHC-type domain-containing protein n=1 Tax=Carex littledalei TaxID=544730 RepID=A0A833QWH3_9POAL|nr:hypothetical protein FCM35_KLT04323 [Carex littledalei]
MSEEARRAIGGATWGARRRQWRKPIVQPLKSQGRMTRVTAGRGSTFNGQNHRAMPRASVGVISNGRRRGEASGDGVMKKNSSFNANNDGMDGEGENNQGWQMIQCIQRRQNLLERRARYGAFQAGENIQSTKPKGTSRGFATEENEKAFAKAFNERRCLCCLAKDHKRSECREPVRCFQCNKLGHKSGRCRIVPKEGAIKEEKKKIRSTRVDLKITYTQALLKHKDPTKHAIKEKM